MTVLSNIITPSNVLTTTNTATVTNKTLTSPTVTGMVVSDGTANGVTYLNGSKVLTSGSALVFDGTNLGVGVTPSAWNSGYKAFQFSSSGVLFGETGNTYLGSNIFVNSGGDNRYITTNFASMYRQVDGKHLWYTAASGTAGNTISFTQAMTLDANSNFGVGVTNPASFTAGGNYTAFAINGSTGSNIALNANGSNIALLYASTGNNLYLTNQTASGAVIFGAGSGTERARIDSSGNLLVGTTTAVGKITVSSASTPAVTSIISATSQLTTVGLTIQKADNNSTTSNWFQAFTINAGATGSGIITANGASAAAFGAFSDSRLKENIVNLPSQLDNIMALRPVEFDYIESMGGGHQIGFIAQEVQTVFPDLVSADPNGMLTLTDMNKNDARLIKAIQEQQAIIESLKARLDAANL